MRASSPCVGGGLVLDPFCRMDAFQPQPFPSPAHAGRTLGLTSYTPIRLHGRSQHLIPTADLDSENALGKRAPGTYDQGQPIVRLMVRRLEVDDGHQDMALAVRAALRWRPRPSMITFRDYRPLKGPRGCHGSGGCEAQHAPPGRKGNSTAGPLRNQVPTWP